MPASAMAACTTKGDEIALVPPDLRRWFRNFGVEKSWGTADSRSSLTLATGGTFNRVEGLPINLGPQIFWNDSWGSARLDVSEARERGGQRDARDVDSGSQRLSGRVDERGPTGIGPLESRELDRRIDEWTADHAGEQETDDQSPPPAESPSRLHPESIRSWLSTTAAVRAPAVP